MNPEQAPQFNKPSLGTSEVKKTANESKLSQRQVFAIKFCAEVGRKIQ